MCAKRIASAIIAIVLILTTAPLAYAQPLTFTRDVAPIIHARCASCHQPGEIGPFSLLTYDDVRQRLEQIRDVTARRIMPPWKPAANPDSFVDERALTSGELQTLQNWIAEGAMQGNPADLPRPPEPRGEWELGTPDLIVRMPDAFLLPPQDGNVFRTFVIPIPTETARYVRALEFRPGNARAVHHANLGVDRTRSSRRLDLLDPGPGYSGGMVPDAGYPPGHMLGWTPGQRPRPVPDGMAWRLGRDSDLVVQLHMQPTGKPEAVQVSVGLHFTDRAPTRLPVGLRLGSETIDIPADEGNYIITDSYVMPVDVELLAIQPHAHNLARRIEADAILPDGTTRSLISIGDWDFLWQDVYRYARPVQLPKGTTVSMRFLYDNSSANPRNPHQPPRRVVWGQNTSDEMGDLWMQLVPRASSDYAALNVDAERKRQAEDLAAYTKLVREDPRNPLRRDTLGTIHLRNGRLEEAAAELRASLTLNPDSAPTHYNLGLTLASGQKFAEAAKEFSEAIRLAPDHAQAHNNLGAVLHFLGNLEEAGRHYRQAVSLRPDNVEAVNNLARLLVQQRRPIEAVELFGRALAINQDFASALAGLAWLRSTSETSLRNGAEAVGLAERADRLTGHQDPSVLDALAAAYAEVGRFDRAVEVGREARAAAERAGLTNLASEIGQRLELYQRKQPYRAP